MIRRTVASTGYEGKNMKSLRRILTIGGLVVLGMTPWAQAQLAQPPLPAICYPLTAFARPTLFNVLFGLPVFRFPFQ